MTQVNVTTSCKTVKVYEADNIHIVKVISAGPQGPQGDAAEGSLPAGGQPGNILMKEGNANYQSYWNATLDGGTFN